MKLSLFDQFYNWEANPISLLLLLKPLNFKLTLLHERNILQSYNSSSPDKLNSFSQQTFLLIACRKNPNEHQIIMVGQHRKSP